jgi:multidrug efflux pump
MAHLPGVAANAQAIAWGTGIIATLAGFAIGWLAGRSANVILGWSFRMFNNAFAMATGIYTSSVSMLMRISAFVLVAYAALLFVTYWGFQETPKGFVPNQDMGYAVINIQTPDATSAEVTRRVVDKTRDILNSTPGVKHSVSVAGQSFFLSAYSSFFGSMFLIFDDFGNRQSPDLYSEKIIGKLQQRFAKEVPEAIVSIFGPTPIRGVGRSGGFKIMLEDQGDTSLDELQRLSDEYVKRGMAKRWPLKEGIDKLSPDDLTAAEMQRTCPVDGALLGSKGDVQRSEPATAASKDASKPDPGKKDVGKTDKPVFFCSDDCKKKFAADPDKYKDNFHPAPPLLDRLINVFSAKMPQQFVAMDRKECMTMGVPLADANNTLQIYLGSLYVNDFNRFGRTWQVIVQADAKFRNSVSEVKALKVRNSTGKMVPLGSIARVEEQNGPLIITRYNMHTAAGINGVPAPNISSGQSIDLAKEIAKEVLPAKTMSYEFTDLAYLELIAGNSSLNIFGLASVMVFLVLAAQYESWSLPLAVILVVPMCLLSAVIGVWTMPAILQIIAGYLGKIPHGWGTSLSNTVGGTSSPSDINIFTQIGLVVLVGLASKNAILIVEFAKRLRSEGATAREATLTACRLRLRPIIMTSFAFILGVMPLLISTGAGAEMRRTLGTAVFSGMLGVTLFGIFLTPVFFRVIDWLGQTRLFHSRFATGLSAVSLAIVFPWMWSKLVLKKPSVTAEEADVVAGDI